MIPKIDGRGGEGVLKNNLEGEIQIEKLVFSF